MTDIIRLIVGLIVPTALGYVVISSLMDKRGQLNLPEHLSLSFLVGAGVLTILMLFMGLAGIRYSFNNIVAFSILLASAPAYISIKKGTIRPATAPITAIKNVPILEVFFFSLILLRGTYSFFEALIKPVITVDAYSNWSLRAKVFFIDGGLSLDRLSGYFLGGGQPTYPIHVPLLESWMFFSLGYWNDQLMKVIFPLFYVALLVLLYFSLRDSVNRLAALIGTYLLSSLPMLLFHSTIEYCDLPLAVYFTSSVLMLIRYLETRERTYLLISSLLAGIMMWTKSEGLPIFLVNLTLIAVSSFTGRGKASGFKPLLLYLLPALAFKLPWQGVNMIFKVPKSEWQRIEIWKAFEYVPRLPVIIEQMYQKFFFYGNWNISWFMFAVVLAFAFFYGWGVKKSVSLIAVLIWLSALFVMYYITPNYVWLLDGTTLNRNTMLLMPILIYFVTICVNDMMFSSPKGSK